MSVSKRCQHKFWRALEELTGRRFRPLLFRWYHKKCVDVVGRNGHEILKQQLSRCADCDYRCRCSDNLADIRTLGASLIYQYKLEHAQDRACTRDAMNGFLAECFLAQEVLRARSEEQLFDNLEDLSRYAKRCKRRHGHHPSQNPYDIQILRKEPLCAPPRNQPKFSTPIIGRWKK